MIQLYDLALIWAAVFFAGYAARKTRLTPVLWYLFIGALLVNLGVLKPEPGEFIHGLSEIGIIFIMFALGFEENTSQFLESIKKSWGIALFGALAPFLTAYGVAFYFWQDPSIALMCGLAMAATAVSLTMVSLKSENLGNSIAATRIMTSAVLDSFSSLALVAILVPVAAGQADITVLSIAIILGKTLLFFLAITIVGGWVLPSKKGLWYSKIPLIGRFDMRQLLSIGKGEYAILTIVLMALMTGLVAHSFGFHSAVGAYMAGLILKEEYFYVAKTAKSYKKAREVTDVFAFEIFGPIFFVTLGAKLLFDWDILSAIIPHVLIMTSCLIVAQITAASLAAHFTSAMSWPHSIMVGFGMLGRAELAFVVMNIAYVENNILPTEAFYTLMFAAFWLNLAVPITIKLWKPYYQANRLPALFGKPRDLPPD